MAESGEAVSEEIGYGAGNADDFDLDAVEKDDSSGDNLSVGDEQLSGFNTEPTSVDADNEKSAAVLEPAAQAEAPTESDSYFGQPPVDSGHNEDVAGENAQAEMDKAPKSGAQTADPNQQRFSQSPFGSNPVAGGGGYALPFPPFLANPFMAPYMPQYGTGQSQEQAGGESGPPESGGGFRYNPYSGGYFFTPTQYQEMIQQYFQGVLAAGGLGAGPGVSTGASPASETGEVVYDDTRECADALKMAKLSEGARQAQPAWFPSYPVPSPWPTAGVGQVPAKKQSPEQVAPVDSRTDNSAKLEECGVSASSAGATNGSSSDVPPATTPSSVHSHPYSFPSPATTVSEHKIGSVPDSIESSPEKTVPDHLVVTASRAEVLASQSDSEVCSERQNGDNPTSMLIKKQMSEIEKEIIRKSANQHIRQVDPWELEAFLKQERDVVQGNIHENPRVLLSDKDKVSEWTESGVPWTSGEEKKKSGFGPARDTRTLNEISSQRQEAKEEEDVRLRPSHFFQPHFPQAAPVAQPQTVLPPVGAYEYFRQAATQRFPGAPVGYPQAGYSPYPNVAHLPQLTQTGGARESRSETSSEVTASPAYDAYKVPAQPLGQKLGGGNASQSQEVIAAQNGNVEGGEAEDQAQQNGWRPSDSFSPGDVHKNDEEPVWVMRESYLRRLKREEERQQQRERREEQLALAHADRAAADSDTDNETDKLLERQRALHQRQQDIENSNQSQPPKEKKKEVMIHEPAVLIEGVLFRARYLGSTQLICEGRPTKATRMMQAQEAVSRIKAPEDEPQPSTEVDLFISTEKIMVLNTDLQRISDTDVRQDIMMDHPLRTISYIADIGDVVVLMARRVSQCSLSPETPDQPSIRRTPKIICHVFESEEAQFIAQSIGQAFQVAYMEFLRANGIDDPRAFQSIDYEEVLNSQEIIGEELEMFANKESQKDVVIPKQKGEILGVVVVESGWGSMLPTVVVANLMPAGPASRCNQLNIGDQIIAINGISLVGLPLSSAQNNIKNTKTQTAVKLTVVHTPPVVEVRIKRPDSKYQLGFSVQNGVICSLLRGGIAERGGVRVGHRIIEINNQSVVAVAHEKIVNMLATAVGEIQMKTMPTSMFRLLTGQETPIYI